jgi:signal transduction histidine kinase
VDRSVTAAKRFLDAVRPQPSRALVDVNALLEDLLILVSPEVQRKGIAVARSLSPGLAPVSADPGQMQELFLNLITNALEAMGRGGTLNLATEGINGDEKSSGVRVIVADTGLGMPPEILARAFEPFFTTREEASGTGLGLAICRRITRDHGGTVRLDSQQGRGTQAIVELPVRTG